MTEQLNKTTEIILLTHADSDLAMISRAASQLPPEFPGVAGANLQSLESDQDMMQLLAGELGSARIILLRLLGRASAVAGFDALMKFARAQGRHLIAISGTGELNPELAAISTVSPAVLQETQVYFQSGGAGNVANCLKYLCDHLLLTGFGFEPPVAFPEHGIYHPDLRDGASLADWLKIRHDDRPCAGLIFYRAHWISGNTRFIDALVRALEESGMDVLPVYTSSLRTVDETGEPVPAAFKYFLENGSSIIDIAINTTSFSLAEINPDGPTASGWSVDALSRLDVPVLQAVTSGMTRADWESSSRGLNPLDAAMNVVMPEFDGRIATVPVSFKTRFKASNLELTDYSPLPDRVKRVAQLAARFVSLRRKPNSAKRIAFVFTNSNAKASQIGNAVGLDSPASLMAVFKSMQAAGYEVGQMPESGDRLIHNLVDRCSYDQTYLSAEQCSQALGKVPAGKYKQWFDCLPVALKTKMEQQWGPPPGEAYFHNGDLIVPGLEFGNTCVILQPPRGYGMDPNAIYHQPDLPPTHQYYAVYRWLSDEWKADAIVHVGKHGTLEWLPGKGVGLSENCYPDALLADMPLFYPFILNDPGEGSQAKRRAHAVVVDHLTPPMTTADTYGVLAELVQLVDEYYQVEMLDPVKLPLLQQQIWELVEKANLQYDLESVLSHELGEHDHDHDDHDHDDHHAHDSEHGKDHHDDHDDHEHEHEHESDEQHWREEVAEHGVPVGLAKMNSFEFSHLIQEIDGYLCELGAAQIRDGLHIFGQAPQGDGLVDLLCSLTRLPNLDVPSLQSEVAALFDLDLKDLLEHKGARLETSPQLLAEQTGRQMITKADAIEAIDLICRKLCLDLCQHDFQPSEVDSTLSRVFTADSLTVKATSRPGLKRVLSFVCSDLAPKIKQSSEEIDNLLRGLAGRYVPAGPSGSPTRGMAHILPTGRNFYAVDPRTLPSQSAWRVGKQLADEVVERHRKETGTYPESVSISIWGTSAMRTHGDDVAEILSLLGVRPLWQAENRRLTGVEVIPLAELGRPRIDVTTRISGFFRDAFPNLVALIDQAVKAVVLLDEPDDMNFVRKHYLAEIAEKTKSGMSEEEATRQAGYRVFGCKPGSYGAGILPLINEKNWQNEDDFAEAYINWGGYAYSQDESGVEARGEFRQRLSQVSVALHNQDNREHDIFDSDDYLQFHGGMIATIRSLTGRNPRRYFGDTHNPARAVVRDLKEETLRVFRSRVVNPKWLESIKRHGYKGGLELTATVDYLFGYDATADVMEDWMYEQVTESYLLCPEMRKFLEQSNPWALNAIAERLLEAAQRKLWNEPSEKTLDALKQAYLTSEAQLEARGERPRLPQGVS